MLRAVIVMMLAGALSLVVSGCSPIVRERTLPVSIRSVHVPMIDNRTSVYGLEERLTVAVQHEILADGRLNLVREREADAIVRIILTDFEAVAAFFDRDDFPTGQMFRLESKLEIVENIPGRPMIGDPRTMETTHFFNADPRTTTFNPEPRERETLAEAFARQLVLELMTGEFEEEPILESQRQRDENFGVTIN